MAERDPVERWAAAAVDLRRLEYFLAVVDHGGVTRAADALPVAQPSLSQALRILERELGATLFERAGRRLVLTDAGRALIAPARQLLRDADAVRTAARNVTELRGGWLDIVTLPTLAVDPLPRLAGRFRRSHPDVGLSVATPGDADEVAQSVHAGDHEVGLTVFPCMGGELRQSELPAQRFDVILPLGTADEDGPLPRTALSGLDWVVTAPGSSTRALLDQALAEPGREPMIAVETDDAQAVVPLVLAGAGATLLPAPMAAEAAERGARVRAVEPPLVRRIGLVYRHGRLSPPARAFLEVAADGP